MTDQARSNSGDVTILGRQISEFPITNVGRVITSFIPEKGMQVEIINFESDKLVQAIFAEDNELKSDINPVMCLDHQTSTSRYGFTHEYTLSTGAYISVGGSYEDGNTHSDLQIYPYGLDGNKSFWHFVESDGRFFQSFVPDGGCVVTDDNVDFKYYNAQGQVISVEDWTPEININFTDITDAPTTEPAPLRLLPDIKPT